MNLMTFSEIVEQNPNLYQGTEVDEATQSLLFDWFQFRQVCDNERFITYYKRKINMEWNHYQELLRIEPGPELSSYDWLVTDYKERQHKNKYNEDNNIKIDTNEEAENNLNGSSTNTITSDTDGTHYEKGNITTENSINNTKGEQIDTIKGTEDSSNVKGQEVDNSDTTETLTRGQSVKNERTSNGTTKNDGYNLTYSDDKRVSSVNPMDLQGSITKGEVNVNFDSDNNGENDQPDPIGSVIKDLNWSTASAQDEGSGFRLDNRNTRDTTSNTETDLTTYGEGSDITKTTQNLTSGQRTDTGTKSNNSTNTSGERKDTSETNGTSETENDIQISQTTEENGVAHFENTEKATKSGNKNETGNRSGFSTDQEITSGRNNQNIATILEDASRFIKNSDAFDWFRKQLEVCFFGIYDI